jgi:hypothetical protein
MLDFLERNTWLEQLYLADNDGLGLKKDFANAVAQCNFSVKSFCSPEADAKEQDEMHFLSDVAKRNTHVVEMLQRATLELTFKALQVPLQVPSSLCFHPSSFMQTACSATAFAASGAGPPHHST